MKKTPQNQAGGLSRRLHFPEDEKRIPWLSPLLDAFAIADTGVAIAIRDYEKKRKKNLACSRGCDVCCRQKDIPVYPHELAGIYWYASEKLEPTVRAVVLRQLTDHAAGSPCPFLVEHACAVHPVRPVACRQYNVFTKPCADGEDPYYTRRDDVLEPLTAYTDRAFAAMRTFYRLEKEQDIETTVRLIRSQIRNLQEHAWEELVRTIDEVRRQQGP
jgi:uncharacterized protein